MPIINHKYRQKKYNLLCEGIDDWGANRGRWIWSLMARDEVYTSK